MSYTVNYHRKFNYLSALIKHYFKYYNDQNIISVHLYNIIQMHRASEISTIIEGLLPEHQHFVIFIHRGGHTEDCNLWSAVNQGIKISYKTTMEAAYEIKDCKNYCLKCMKPFYYIHFDNNKTLYL